MLTLLPLLAGCGWVAPSVDFAGAELTELGWDHVAAEVAFAVESPLPFDVELHGLQWSLSVADHVISSGASDEAVNLPADGTGRVIVPVVVRAGDLPTLSDLSDPLPFRLEGSVDLGTRVGRRTVPFVYQGEVPLPRAPQWRLVSWTAERSGAAVRVELVVDPDLPKGWTVDTLDWQLEVATHPVALGHMSAPAPGLLKVPVEVDMAEVGGAAMTLLRGHGAGWALTMRGVVQTPLGPLPIQVERPLAGA